MRKICSRNCLPISRLRSSFIHATLSGGVPLRPKYSRGEDAQRPRAEHKTTSLASPSQLSALHRVAAAGEAMLARVPFQGLAPFFRCVRFKLLFFLPQTILVHPPGASRSGWCGARDVVIPFIRVLLIPCDRYQSFVAVFALALLVLGIPGDPVVADGRGSVARRIPQIHPVDEAWRFLLRRSCLSLIRGRGGARFYVWSSAVGRPKAACGKLK
jgi:hypothetical protein